MSAGYAEKATVVSHHSPTKLRNVALEVNQVLRLLSSVNIIEVNVLITPLKIVNNTLICQLLLKDEDVLEKLKNPLLDVKVVELCDHSLLIFEVALILVN
jgi:hypothetical protein